MDSFYSASEAIEKLNLPRSTFYYLVQRGEIPKAVMPLRKQAVYPKDEIDRLASARSHWRGLRIPHSNSNDFVITLRFGKDDLEQLAELAKCQYDNDNGVWTGVLAVERDKGGNDPKTDTDIAVDFFRARTIIACKSASRGTVLGGIALSPLKLPTLRQLLRFERNETEVARERDHELEVQRPSLDDLIDVFVWDMLVRPGQSSAYVGALLLRASLRYAELLLECGIAIGTLSTIATTDAGDHLAQRLGFELLPTPESKAPSRPSKRLPRSYVLDVLQGSRATPLVREYRQVYRNARRRMRRTSETDRRHQLFDRFLQVTEA